MQHLVTSQIRVLILHADVIVAFGLSAAFGLRTDFHVEVGSLPRGAASRADFDVVVCDLDTALGLCSHPAAAAGRSARLLVMTTHDQEQAVRRALESGVHGYVLQGCPLDELVGGVRAVSRGQRYLSLAVAQRLAESMTRESLTGREVEVLALLVLGACNKSIARELEIAVGTVKAHVKAILSKLEASSRTQAVSVAAQRGLVNLRPDEPNPAARHMAPAARRAPTFSDACA